MPEQVDRVELLHRWAELAPGECTYFPRTPLDRNGRAVLLSALIDCIRARGWNFTLTGTMPEEGQQPYRAHVIYGGPRCYDYADASEPCDSLLQAYVSSLESLKDSPPVGTV